MIEQIAPVFNIQYAINIYKQNSQSIEKSDEEKKDEEIRIKPTHCGQHVDLLV